MAYPAINCRFITPTGWIRRVTVHWKRPEGCRVEAAYCNERRNVDDGPGIPADDGWQTQLPAPWTPGMCEDCAKPYDGSEAHATSMVQMRWSTESGRPEPGDLLYITEDIREIERMIHVNGHTPHEGCDQCVPGAAGPMACGDLCYARSAGEPEDAPQRIATAGWHNCDGRHLVCILPNGHPWDVDGRANNCTMPNERLHRCWVRHGSPENLTVHVSKNGPSCAAGAGSILSGDYHGFLQMANGRSTLTAG
jgi:hypothetical protein